MDQKLEKQWWTQQQRCCISQQKVLCANFSQRSSCFAPLPISSPEIWPLYGFFYGHRDYLHHPFHVLCSFPFKLSQSLDLVGKTAQLEQGLEKGKLLWHRCVGDMKAGAREEHLKPYWQIRYVLKLTLKSKPVLLGISDQKLPAVVYFYCV